MKESSFDNRLIVENIFRNFGLPVPNIIEMKKGENLEISIIDRDLRNSYPEGTIKNRYITDGEKVWREWHRVSNKGRIEKHSLAYIRDATFAINIEECVCEDSLIRTSIKEVAIWPECDYESLKIALSPELRTIGAEDIGYTRALNDFNGARSWLAKNFKIRAHPEKGDRVLINGRDFFVDCEDPRNPKILNALLREHGGYLFVEEGSDQFFFLRAKENLEEAALYVFMHYRVVAVEEGKIRFALRSSPKELGDVNSTFLNNQEERPLKILLEAHKSLKEVLFAQAEEQAKETPLYYPQFRYDFRFNKNGRWEGFYEREHHNRQVNGRPFAYKEDVVTVTFHDREFSGNLLCLSDVKRQQGINTKTSSVNFQGVLKDGDLAYVNNSQRALLQIKPGEVKKFVFQVWHAEDKKGFVWGVVAYRTETNRVIYKPYDNGMLYEAAEDGYYGKIHRKPFLG